MESATEMKILEEDSKTGKEEYDRACSELWFALRKWMEFMLIMFSPQIDFSRLAEQMTGRQFAPGKFNRVESKKDYKTRNAGRSPDEADTMTLLVHVVRVSFGVIPSMNLSKGATSENFEFVEPVSKSMVSLANRLDPDLD